MNIIQRIRIKLELTRKGIQDQMQRGRDVSEQMKAEKLRNKNSRVVDGKPGAFNTVRKHLLMKTMNPFEVAKDEYDRRKYEREKK